MPPQVLTRLHPNRLLDHFFKFFGYTNGGTFNAWKDWCYFFIFWFLFYQSHHPACSVFLQLPNTLPWKVKSPDGRYLSAKANPNWHMRSENWRSYFETCISCIDLNAQIDIVFILRYERWRTNNIDKRPIPRWLNILHTYHISSTILSKLSCSFFFISSRSRCIRYMHLHW